MGKSSDQAEITTLLMNWRDGDGDAGNRLFAVAYDELQRLARQSMSRERPGHTLQPTALVHELYLRLFGSAPVAWQSRAHFFGVAAQMLRRILIDHARRTHADKREGDRVRVSLCDAGEPLQTRDEQVQIRIEDLLDLDEALTLLEKLDERATRVVELRYFGGLSEPESAEALGISIATLKRDWQFARAWLNRHMTSSSQGDGIVD